MDQEGPKRNNDESKESSKPSWWQDDFEDDDSQLKFFGPDGKRTRRPQQPSEPRRGAPQRQPQQQRNYKPPYRQQHSRPQQQGQADPRQQRTGQRQQGQEQPRQQRTGYRQQGQEQPRQHRTGHQHPGQQQPRQFRPAPKPEWTGVQDQQTERRFRSRVHSKNIDHRTRRSEQDDRYQPLSEGKRRFDPNRKPRYERGDVDARTVAGLERPQRQAPRRIPGTTLVKALVSYQFASRRISLAAIEQGRVTVNDVTTTEPNSHVKLDKDFVAVDGILLQRKSIKPMTAVFHKPHGLIGSREEYRLSLYSSLANKRNWYVPSGALVKSAAGIVIVSNDRKHANYETSIIRAFTQDLCVKVNRRVTAEEVASLKELLLAQLPEDKDVLEVVKGQDNARSSWIWITCRSGNFHGIAVALKSLGLEVLSEERKRLGPFSTADLQPGAWYRLSDQEVVALDELATGAMPETTPLKVVWDNIATRLFDQQGESS